MHVNEKKTVLEVLGIRIKLTLNIQEESKKKKTNSKAAFILTEAATGGVL